MQLDCCDCHWNCTSSALRSNWQQFCNNERRAKYNSKGQDGNRLTVFTLQLHGGAVSSQMLFCRPQLQPVIIWVPVAFHWSPTSPAITTPDPWHRQGTLNICSLDIFFSFSVRPRDSCERFEFIWTSDYIKQPASLSKYRRRYFWFSHFEFMTNCSPPYWQIGTSFFFSLFFFFGPLSQMDAWNESITLVKLCTWCVCSYSCSVSQEVTKKIALFFWGEGFSGWGGGGHLVKQGLSPHRDTNNTNARPPWHRRVCVRLAIWMDG